MSRGLLWFVALWVMGSDPANIPPEDGEKPTTMDVDFPGARLNPPPPLTTEKGPEGSPTFPVNAAVEVGSFAMVRVWVSDLPRGMVPKFTEVALIERLITMIPVPITGTSKGLV